ncbi:hypothetical protein AB9F42_34485, partial [Rhizobium leguminosarum]
MHLDTEHPKPERAYREFNLDRPCNIIFVGHHLSTGTQVRCLIRTIALDHGRTDLVMDAEDFEEE